MDTRLRPAPAGLRRGRPIDTNPRWKQAAWLPLLRVHLCLFVVNAFKNSFTTNGHQLTRI